MTSSTKKKQTLHISLQVIIDNNPGEPIAEFHAEYSGHPAVQVYDVFDEELAEELDHIQTPTWVAEDVLYKFDDCEADVTYDSTCHFLCDSTKCLVPSTPEGACPGFFLNREANA